MIRNWNYTHDYPPKEGWRLKRDSMSKMKVLVGDTWKTYYSYDWANPKKMGRSQQRGYVRLKKFYDRNFRGCLAHFYSTDNDRLYARILSNGIELKEE